MTPIMFKNSTTNTTSDGGNSTTYIAPRNIGVRAAKKTVNKKQLRKLLNDYKEVKRLVNNNQSRPKPNIPNVKPLMIRTGHR